MSHSSVDMPNLLMPHQDQKIRHKRRKSLLTTSALTVILIEAAFVPSSAQAACLLIGENVPCSGTLDETINATGNNNILYSGGASGSLTFNGLGGNDTISFAEGSTLSAKSGTTIASGGDGNDDISADAASVLTGNILGDAGNDKIQIQGASTLTGSIYGGADEDFLWILGAGVVNDTLYGDAGNDTLLISGGATIEAGDGGDGNDVIVLTGASTVKNYLLGGIGADTMLVEGASTLEGDLRGGNDNDDLRVRGNSSVEGDILGAIGADTLIVYGGSTIDGSLEAGVGDDMISVGYDDNDSVTANDGLNTIGTDILGGDGNDTILLDLETQVDGDVDGGADQDWIIVQGDSTISGDLLGGSGNDTLVATETSSLNGDAGIDGGDGNDLITVQDSSAVESDVVGGAGVDSLLLESTSSIGGALDGGLGNDALRVRGDSTVSGSVTGGEGADDIVIEDGSTISTNVMGDGSGLDVNAGNDTISVDGTGQNLTSITGLVDGGGGNDTIKIGENSDSASVSITGTVFGGAGDDAITVDAGALNGGISAGDGNDIVTLNGGLISGTGVTSTLAMGDGNDALTINNDSDLANQVLNIGTIFLFDGGAGTDTATLNDFYGPYVDQGLKDRQFNAWDSVTFANSLVDLTAGQTITTLNLTQGTVLYQTESTLSLMSESGTDGATLTVDDTSAIEMRDDVYALFDQTPPLRVIGGPPSQICYCLPPSLADDAITVGNLELTGQIGPATNVTFAIDFDADDLAYQNGRDDAPAGNADQIDVSGTITLSGVVGIDINTVGGMANSGLPLSLSGSVAVIDDLNASALSNPGIGATLTASTAYVTDDLFFDPGRDWALVDQGTNGVFLQWTTPVNTLTTGPNAQADLGAGLGGSGVVSGVMGGLVDNTLRKVADCAPTAEGLARDCAMSSVTTWAQVGKGQSSLEATQDATGFDTDQSYFAGGFDYSADPNWSVGFFGAVQKSSLDFGAIEGEFGARASSADLSAGYGGVYLKSQGEGPYVTAMAMLGKAQTSLINGVLFDATSEYDSNVGVLGATAGDRVAIPGQDLTFDPRLQASYATSATDTYRDSFGMDIAASSKASRVAATLGLTYHPQGSGLSMTLRAGGAVLAYDTRVDASEDASTSTASVTNYQQDQVFTASFDATWALGANSLLSGSISTDSGSETQTMQGGLTLAYKF